MEGWDVSEEWSKKAGKQARLYEEIKLKIIGLDVPLEDAIEVLEIVKIACKNAIRSEKSLRTHSRIRRQEGYSSGETTIVGG